MELESLKEQIQTLGTAQLRELASWLASYRESRWDEDISDDVAAGRLDPLLEEVTAEYKAGLTTPL